MPPDRSAPNERPGDITTLGHEVDEAYMTRLATLVLDPELVRSQRDLRIVYTPIHGTGAVIIQPMLERLGFNFEVVVEQDRFDGRFPTVQSPNPENAEALEAGDRAGDEARRGSRDRDRSGLRSNGRGGARAHRAK